MKWFLILWAGPLAFLGGWYGLSYYDINFGTFILSRQAHDLIFTIYGRILGVDPQAVPLLIARALAIDSLFVFALMAFRRREQIIAWWKARRLARVPVRQPVRSRQSVLASDESLSSAP